LQQNHIVYGNDPHGTWIDTYAALEDSGAFVDAQAALGQRLEL
jgi:hypothetical protein